MATRTKHNQKHRTAPAAKRGRTGSAPRRESRGARKERAAEATDATRVTGPAGDGDRVSAEAHGSVAAWESVEPGLDAPDLGAGAHGAAKPEEAALVSVLAGGEPVVDAEEDLFGAAVLAAAPDFETAEASVADDEAPELEAAAEDLDEEEAEPAAGAPAARSKDEEPQSFLAMYFRDMAELDVLRPEQEFETARAIESLEIDLWRIVLSYAPAANVTADAIERAMEKEYAELKPYRAAAEKAAAPKAGAVLKTRLEKVVAELAPKLRDVDIDRLFIDAAVGEVQRLGRAARGLPVEGALPPFATTKGFASFARTALAKAHEVKAAKNAFVKANLRLVVSIARRFNHGRLPLADLIQEGNIGLMKAVERYDYRRGFRFSTYASWWIRHAISRALADKGRAVRLPVHMIDAYHRIAKSERELQSKLDRPATNDEIASAAGIESDKLEKMRTFLNETPVSLDRPISDDDGRRLIDVLADPQDTPAPPDQMVQSETHQEMLKLLSSLKPIEADILRKRFGLLNDREQTLKEIGDEYQLSRERVRQLQEQALGKMRKAMAKLEVA